MFKMRHIATAENSNIFLSAEYEKKVYAWDINDFKKISEFDTVLDYGGSRLAISGDGMSCVAAAYTRYGIGMYDVATGKLLWQRKDIKKTQNIKFNLDSQQVYAGIEDAPMVLLNRFDGNKITKLNATTNIYFNPYGANFTLKGGNIIRYENQKICSPTFTFLDVEPTISGVVLSAVGNNLMCYSCINNEKIWEIAPNRYEHFIKIGYSKKYDMVNAVLFKYSDLRKKPYYILYGISTSSGEVIYKFGLPYESCEFGLTQNGEKLICSSGEIFLLSCDPPKLIYKFDWD